MFVFFIYLILYCIFASSTLLSKEQDDVPNGFVKTSLHNVVKDTRVGRETLLRPFWTQFFHL